MLLNLNTNCVYFTSAGIAVIVLKSNINSSHSPDFVNALELDELFWLSKENGYTNIKRASNDPAIESLYNGGDKLGYLWKQGYFIGSGPKK